MLGSIFENLIPHEEQVLLGQFYTPRLVADLLAAFTIDGDDDVMLVPDLETATRIFVERLVAGAPAEGIAKAKGEGKYRGRAPTARAKSADIRRLAAEGLTRRPASLLKIGVASVYRV